MESWHFEEVWRFRQAIWSGFLTTLQLNLVVLIFGTLLGCVIAGFRLSHLRLLRWVGRAFVDLFRSLPLLVLLVWLFFALPLLPGLNLRIGPFAAAAIGLSLNLGAFVAEIIRAGVKAVPHYHIEAGLVAGFSRLQTWRYITAPITFRLMIAPLFGQYINQIKLSVLASIIAVDELLHTINTISAQTFRPLELYTTLAVIFLIILLPCTWLQAHLEAKRSSRTADLSIAGEQVENGDELPPIGENLVRKIPNLDGWSMLPPGTRLVVENLVYGYERASVLREISVEAQRGTVTALIGANGSGKTTLIRCVCNILRPESGRIRLVGKNGCATGNGTRGVRYGYMSQEHEPWPHLSVLGNLLLPIRVIMNKPPEKALVLARAWLKVVNLEHRADAMPSELSGGQRQRLVLARTLCLYPEVVLLDEPTSAMDFRWAVSVHDLIRALSEIGLLVIAVSHGLGFLRSAAHNIVFLDRGTVGESGAAGSMLRKPQSLGLKTFLEAA